MAVLDTEDDELHLVLDHGFGVRWHGGIRVDRGSGIDGFRDHRQHAKSLRELGGVGARHHLLRPGGVHVGGWLFCRLHHTSICDGV